MIGGQWIARAGFVAERPEGVFVFCFLMRSAFIFVVSFLFIFQKGVKLKAALKVGAKRSRSFGAGESKAAKGILFIFLRALAVPLTCSQEGDRRKSNLD